MVPPELCRGLFHLLCRCGQLLHRLGLRLSGDSFHHTLDKWCGSHSTTLLSSNHSRIFSQEITIAILKGILTLIAQDELFAQDLFTGIDTKWRDERRSNAIWLCLSLVATRSMHHCEWYVDSLSSQYTQLISYYSSIGTILVLFILSTLSLGNF
jgi:hypothetical protein